MEKGMESRGQCGGLRHTVSGHMDGFSSVVVEGLVAATQSMLRSLNVGITLTAFLPTPTHSSQQIAPSRVDLLAHQFARHLFH
jgi:hypothetical protein